MSDGVTSTAMKMRGKVSPAVFRAVICIVAFVTGAIVMSFEMSIAGTLGTTFFLIPTIGTRAITLWLGGVGMGCGLFLFALDRVHLAKKAVWSTVGLVVFAILAIASNRVCADDLM